MLLERHAEGARCQQLETFEQAYQEIAIPIRTYMKLEDLRTLLKFHQSLLESLHQVHTSDVPTPDATSTDERCTQSSTPRGEHKFVHIQHTNLLKNNVSNPPLGDLVSMAMSNQQGSISTGVVIQGACSRFRLHLPITTKPLTWNALIEGAYKLKDELHISQESWVRACGGAGRVEATLCVILTSFAVQSKRRSIRHPAAYFRELINRAIGGQLDFKRSLIANAKQGALQQAS